MKVHKLKIDPMFWGSLVIGEKKPRSVLMTEITRLATF